MSSESLSASPDDFFRIAEELVMLTKDEALIIEEAVRKTGQSPEQIAVQKGYLDAAQVDIIDTLLKPHDTVPGYEILDVLGQGGMGVVYRARQLNLNRIVALKTILLSRMTDKSAGGRFEQEAQTVGMLRHPNIVAAYDFGRHEGRLFLAMELVEGEDVDALLKDEGRLDEETAWGLVRQAAAGLAHANRLGVVHRDIKPANLLLVEPPEGFPLPPNLPMVKIADFGLAFLADDQQAHTRLTSDNAAVGSPHYMAPEQLTDTEVDFRADIYALGATVYHMLAGRPPFSGLNLSQIIAQKLSGEIKRLSERCPDVSDASCHLVARMLARDPAERFDDYRSLMTAIDELNVTTVKTPAKLPSAMTVGSAGRITDVVSKEDTQVMPRTDAPDVETNASRFPSHRPHRRWMLAAAVLTLMVALGAGVWQIVSAKDSPPLPVPMRGMGADIPLFYGTTTKGWINNYGNWVAERDDELATVLEGTGGEIIRPLPARETPDGNRVSFPYYRLTLEVDPNEASAVEVRFGIVPGDPLGGPQYTVRLERSGVTLGERDPATNEIEKLTAPLPLNGEFARRHLIRIERQPTGWFVTIDGRALPGLPHRSKAELSEFRLAADGGPAWFSDIFVEELVPVESTDGS